jgi:hypothetical protein
METIRPVFTASRAGMMHAMHIFGRCGPEFLHDEILEH